MDRELLERLIVHEQDQEQAQDPAAQEWPAYDESEAPDPFAELPPGVSA